MKGQELFYPEVSVQVGGYLFGSGLALNIASAKDTSYDWAKIRFTKEYQPHIGFQAMDPAEIRLGYNGSLQSVFTGYVARPYNAAAGMDEILIKDEMARLDAMRITNTFLDATPQEIAAYALTRAGVTSMELVRNTYLPKERVPVVNKSVLELLKYLQNLWAMGNLLTCIRDGTFYWGVTPPQERTYQFSYGENIIALTRESGLWELETVSMPFIRHSDCIQVTHPKLSGSFEVQKMVSTTNQNGFIRTRLYFKGEN